MGNQKGGALGIGSEAPAASSEISELRAEAGGSVRGVGGGEVGGGGSLLGFQSLVAPSHPAP